MRLLIESRNRWTIELASCKHDKLGRPSAHTFVSNNLIQDKNVDWPDNTDNATPTKASDSSVYRYTQLPRRKSIHKRIGRFFLRVSRMHSDAQYDAYAYEYGLGASELPAGGSPIEGSTSFQEMPGSFPPDGIFELEDEHYSMSTSYAQTAPEHLRDYFKSNQNATMRRPAPVPVTHLPQLPRLEVPKSQHCVPRLMPDHFSVTPSPISPITPVLNATGAPSRSPNSQHFLDTISPYANPKQAQIFAHYGSLGQYAHHSPATPSTIGSSCASNNTTPLSAHPSSGHSSFHAWPQARDGQLLPKYSQDYLSGNYDQNTTNAMNAGIYSWQSNMNAQPHLHNRSFRAAQIQGPLSNAAMDSRQNDSFSHAQSRYGTQTYLSAANLQTTIPQPGYVCNDAPPAYSPIVPDSPPSTNPQNRYPPAPCQLCEKIFTGKYGPGNLKRHVRQTHESVFDKAMHMCKTCFKTYNRADALRKHSWKKHRQEDARPNKRRK
ncbi:hypothetical protein M3J07_006929 [Ascochyta lentis]